MPGRMITGAGGAHNKVVIMSDTALAPIREALEAGLQPLVLEVENESARHAGHAGAQGRSDGGITHLRVRVVAEGFAGKSRIERHRMVNALLQNEISRGLHALAIEAKAPGE